MAFIVANYECDLLSMDSSKECVHAFSETVMYPQSMLSCCVFFEMCNSIQCDLPVRGLANSSIVHCSILVFGGIDMIRSIEGWNRV